MNSKEIFKDNLIISDMPHKANILLMGGSGHNGRKIVPQLIKSDYINSLSITGIESEDDIRNNLNLDNLLNSEECVINKEKVNVVGKFDVKDFSLSWKVLEEFIQKNFVANTTAIIHLTLFPELYNYVLNVLDKILQTYYSNSGEFITYSKEKLYIFIEKPVILDTDYINSGKLFGYSNIDYFQNIYLIDHYFGKDVIYYLLKENRLSKVNNKSDLIFLPTGGRVNIQPRYGGMHVNINPYMTIFNDNINTLFVCHEDDENSYKHRNYFLNKYGIFYDMVYGHIIGTLQLITLNLFTFYYHDGVILDHIDKRFLSMDTDVITGINELYYTLESFNPLTFIQPEDNILCFRHTKLSKEGNENYILIQKPLINILEENGVPLFNHSTLISCGKLTGEHKKFVFIDVHKDEDGDGIHFDGYLYIEFYPSPKILYEFEFANKQQGISFSNEIFKEFSFQRNEYINIYEDILSGIRIIGKHLNISKDINQENNISKVLISSNYDRTINKVRELMYEYTDFQKDIKEVILEKL